MEAKSTNNYVSYIRGLEDKLASLKEVFNVVGKKVELLAELPVVKSYLAVWDAASQELHSFSMSVNRNEVHLDDYEKEILTDAIQYMKDHVENKRQLKSFIERDGQDLIVGSEPLPERFQLKFDRIMAEISILPKDGARQQRVAERITNFGNEKIGRGKDMKNITFVDYKHDKITELYDAFMLKKAEIGRQEFEELEKRESLTTTEVNRLNWLRDEVVRREQKLLDRGIALPKEQEKPKAKKASKNS